MLILATLGSGPGDAPAFSAKTADGKTTNLNALTANGPIILYFIGNTCPINAQAEKYYNRVYDAYKGKGRIVGIIDCGQTEYKAWQKQFKAPFPVLFDPDQKIIKAYHAERSPWVIEVTKGRKLGKQWHGYSTGYLQELSSAIASSLKMKAQKIDFSGAPATPRYG